MKRYSANMGFGSLAWGITCFAIVLFILFFSCEREPRLVKHEQVEIEAGQVWTYDPLNEDRLVLKIENDIWVTYRNLAEDMNSNEWPSVNRLMTSWFRMGSELRSRVEP